MKKYKVQINGENFLINLGEGIQKYGFYVNRFVEATDEENAKLKAIDSLKQRADIWSILKDEHDDPPLLNIEEVTELGDFEGLDDLKQGFSWYLDESKIN